MLQWIFIDSFRIIRYFSRSVETKRVDDMQEKPNYDYALIALGSNCGDRAAHLLNAISALLSLGLCIERLSSIYETAPVDYLNQPSFLNMAALLSPPLPSPSRLLSMLLSVEDRLGRVRDIPKGPRNIDLDLLVCGNIVQSRDSEGSVLELPHPRMHLRRFVMVPVVEICPTGVHPLLERSFYQILQAIPEDSSVVPYLG